MKEVIAEILEEEKKARERVAAARKKAGEIRESAESEAGRLSAEARARLKTEMEEVLAGAEKEALSLKDGDMKAAEGAGRKLWEGRRKEILSTVDALFQLVLGREKK